jgi:bifunctional DNase/RNase
LHAGPFRRDALEVTRLLAAAALAAASVAAADEGARGGGERARPGGEATRRTTYQKVDVLEVRATQNGAAVILVERDLKLAVPIFIGPAEGLAIEMRLKKVSLPRPLTHDLLEDVIEALGARLLRVEVDDLKGDVFFGRLVLDQKGKQITIDARPSDSIALALGLGAPIHVAKRVLDRAGLPLGDLEKGRVRPAEEGKVESL